MKRIRIGNTIYVSWSILTNGEAESLDGRDVKVYVSSSLSRRVIEPVTVAGNVVSFAIEGKDQVRCGVYDLTLVENEGKANQSVLDACRVYELVDRSCKASQDSCCDNVSAEYVELTGNVQTFVGGSTSRVRVTFSPYGSDDEYDMGNISGDLFERFFDEVPESTWQDVQMYPYYAYGDMGDGENFSGIGEWGDEPEEEVNDGEVSA